MTEVYIHLYICSARMTEHMTAAQLGNWVREFAQWYPALRVLKFYGTKEERALIRERDLQVMRA